MKMMLDTWEVCEKNIGTIMIDHIESCFSPRKWYSTSSKYSKLGVSWPISKFINASFHDYTYSAKVTRGQWSIWFHILKKNYTVKIQPILSFFTKFVSGHVIPSKLYVTVYNHKNKNHTHIWGVILSQNAYWREPSSTEICKRGKNTKNLW